MCFEKRLVITADQAQPGTTAAAYGELGDIHRSSVSGVLCSVQCCVHSELCSLVHCFISRLLGNYEQAINCMEHRLNMARSEQKLAFHLMYYIIGLCMSLWDETVFNQFYY